MIQVVDASAIVALLLDDGHDGRWCEERILEADVVAPHLMHYEAANIIRRSEARGAVDPSEAAMGLRDLLALDVTLVPFDAVADRAWDLRPNATIYDAAYVATAELVGGRLVTLDRKLGSTPGARCQVLFPPD